MYLLDTNICVALMQGNPATVAKFDAKSLECYLPTIVLAELYKGVYCSRQIERHLSEVNLFVREMEIVPFDGDAAAEFGIIQGELRRMGRPTGELDALIAAVARSRGDIVVTHNTRDFINIPGLQLEDWLI